MTEPNTQGERMNPTPSEKPDPVSERWTIYVCPKCDRTYSMSGGCGECERLPFGARVRPVLRQVEVVPASALTDLRRVEAAYADLRDKVEWALAVPDTNRYGQPSDPGSVLRETRDKLRALTPDQQEAD